MEIVKIHNNWREEVLNIDIALGNYCNYKCSYCWPGSNTGTNKYPDINIIKQNLSHFINHYLQNTNKKIFDIHFCGGEPSHWKNLPEFMIFLKTHFNCLISMTSNGSKSFSWWQSYARYFDRVHLSCHHEFTDLEKLRQVCDYLYEQNVVVSVSVMMDPRQWKKCMDSVDYLKKSKRSWTIRYVEIIGLPTPYTEDQKLVLSKHRARRINFWFFLKNNKYYRSIVKVTDKFGKKHRLQDNEILLNRMNNFYGWECSLGVNWVNISSIGEISGTCGQKIYSKEFRYNLYDQNFKDKFNPLITATICEKSECVCTIETVMPKEKLDHTKKIIPIYENRS